MSEPEYCACFSCNGECGGDCGPATPTHRGPVCAYCAEKADVFDDDRTGAKVSISGGRVVLSVDVFDTYRKRSIYLTGADVDALVMALLGKRRELQDQA